MADSPAQRADVLPGDRITSVDGLSLRGERLGDLVQKLRGPAGTRVALHLIRDDTGRDVELTREQIDLASISITEPRAGILLLRVSLFHDRTAKEIREAISTALEKATPLRGLVLDLRGNPGGLLTSAVEVSDLFIDQGLIVRTAGRSDESHVSYAATSGDVIAGLPIGVLIDAGTASAAEVVAAALQDHERAVIFGTRSYGKGSVQTLFRVPGERGIKLTTARYFGPSGRSIDGIGVEPDVIWRGDYETLTTHAVERLVAGKTIPAPV
jgi:carboxyl-terminal processing protease